MESREHRTPGSGSASTPPPNSSPHVDLELQEIELEERLNLYNKQALHLARSGRPENTKKAYKPRQKEWREFCTHQKFPDGAQVTEKKLIYFLETEVVNRQIRPSRYQQNRTTAATNGKCIKQTLGISSIRGYIAAIVDLWSFQKNYGENQHPNPRGDALTSLLASYTRRETARKREQFLDRAAGTLQDEYNHDKMLELVRFCWQGWMMQEKRHRKPQAVESYLRTIVDFLLSHNMLLRGESRRMLEFADLFTIFLPHEGPTPCWPMIMIMNNGKTNPFGRLEYMGVMRHCDPLLCTMGQTAFYLFYRWNIVREPPPQFRQRQQWYGLHLLRGTSQGDKPISYEIQLEWINRVFAAINMTTLKKTHIGRSQGARQAELQGVEEGQIRRAGQWNNDALSNCYLTHLPQKFLRTMAGFEPSNQGNYYLPRAKIVPPRALVQAVWPWVDEWLDVMG